ncbi:hypothetical protein [Chitinophaga ginsengisoli]|uniref:Uncharacterized protein n=1 Tax=Chitinophaga ginsengisoli TaxID=363837 RepID=A0A2P8FT24_9BACT|nr:hypothetical protein [Chitinophaga ginsengisoli]PSL24866.1 hypothetical protein CLV42_11415 [Chitinophaga ginsengisoli]
MKENVSRDSVLYEQIALDYFVAHDFLEKDYSYDMVYYKPVINPVTSQFHSSTIGRELSAEAYKTDSSVEIPDLSGKRLIVVVPPDFGIAEEYEGIVDNTYYLYLEVYTRLPLINGHCMVDIEINGYKFFDRYFIEINCENNKVMNCFVTGMHF